ncbi:MAG: MBL fold metallo-hydrolase [Thermoproteota archaeon]
MEILSGVHWVEGVNANTYLLTRGDGKLAVVDTGMPGAAKKILEYASKRMNRDPKDLKTILLTHCHPDHAGSALELKELTGAKIAIHKDDADYVAGRKKLPPIKDPYLRKSSASLLPFQLSSLTCFLTMGK